MSSLDVVIANIRKIVKEKGMKYKAVAEKAGYTGQQFSDMLNKRKTIECNDIGRIVNALGITPNDIFGITRKE